MSKGLEALDITKDQLDGLLPKGLTPNMKWNIKTIEKELKALEIIKPYLNEIVGMNVYDKDFYECFIQIGNKRVFITKEKYDLLKEVLL